MPLRQERLRPRGIVPGRGPALGLLWTGGAAGKQDEAEGDKQHGKASTHGCTSFLGWRRLTPGHGMLCPYMNR